jgi:KDO2-lipid IV(A) lauroyltransferase
MLNVRLIRAGVFVRRFLPDPLAHALAGVVGDLCWLLLRRRRRILENSLARTAMNRSPVERQRLARTTFRNLARCLADVLAAPSMTPGQLLGLIDRSGLEHLDAALARGRGAIVISGHLGNFELAGLLLAALGYRCHTVAESIAPELDRLFTRFRSATGATVTPLERGAGPSLRALDRNEVDMLVADRAIHSTSVPVRFAGGRRPWPSGPAARAIARGTPILVGSVMLNPSPNGRRYVGVMNPEIPTDGLTAADVPRLAQEVADQLSEVVLRYPDQWFVFQPDWLPDAS